MEINDLWNPASAPARDVTLKDTPQAAHFCAYVKEQTRPRVARKRTIPLFSGIASDYLMAGRALRAALMYLMGEGQGVAALRP